MNKEIIVIYHRNCIDGFGSAYAAWKKFGIDAEYIAVQNRDKPEIDLTGKEVYIVDFSYLKDVLLDIEKKASRLVILDHHIGVKDAVEAVKEHVFDNNRSGCGISWEYFHPNIPLPKMLAYIQDYDLWRYVLPHTKEIITFIDAVEFNFVTWDKLVQQFEDNEQFIKTIEQGKTYRKYFDYLCEHISKEANEVEFEGYRVLAVNVDALPQLLRSSIGNMLALKKPPFGIVWGLKNNFWRFSLRGDGSVDLASLAARYGGSGHRNSAAFRLPLGSPLPFTFISEKETL